MYKLQNSSKCIQKYRLKCCKLNQLNLVITYTVDGTNESKIVCDLSHFIIFSFDVLFLKTSNYSEMLRTNTTDSITM